MSIHAFFRRIRSSIDLCIACSHTGENKIEDRAPAAFKKFILFFKRLYSAIYARSRPPGQSDGQEESSAERPRSLWVAWSALLLLLLGCSASDLVLRATPTPVPTRAIAPTFTPTSEELVGVVVVTPAQDETPGVIRVPPDTDPRALVPPPPTATPSDTPIPSATPTETPTPGPSATPTETPTGPPTGTPTATHTWTPTFTPTPTPSSTPSQTPTPTVTPTPFIVVDTGLVSLRTGPGVEYPLIAQLGPNIPIAVVGRTEDFAWLQICCVSGDPVWVAANSVVVTNDINTIPVVSSAPPPTPTPTFTPTQTGTPTPTFTPTPYPFGVIQRGPELSPTTNQFLTIWVKLSIGTAEGPPADGYYLRVLFEGVERPNTYGNQPSADVYQENRIPGSGNPREYNYKYEYLPPDLSAEGGPDRLEALGTGTWTAYVIDGAGNQISPPVTFVTEPSNPFREVWIHWVRIR